MENYSDLLIVSFMVGFIVNLWSRRFGKFMPSNLAVAIYEIFKLPKFFKKSKSEKITQYKKKLSKLIYSSILTGVISVIVTYLVFENVVQAHIFPCFYLGFIWLLLVMALVDIRIELLPDILTIPFLILGVVAANFGALDVTAIWSSLGLAFGYFMPVVACLLIAWRNRYAFGGGDIKLLAGLGAWFGIGSLLSIVIISSVIMLVFCLVNKKRAYAYGPFLVFAAFIEMVFLVGV